MKVIFLDIDGVLNSSAYDRKRDWDKLTNIDESRLPLVKRIVDETGAKIVLSSTWRVHWDTDAEKCDADGGYLNETFSKCSLEIFSKTPDLGMDGDRPEEIRAWLDAAAEPVERFVVLDDYRYAWGKLSDFFVKTNPRFGLGLEEGHVLRAIEILNG